MRFFARHVRGMLRKRFHAVRVESGSRDVLDAFGRAARPGIVVQNHASWWDPLLPIYLWSRFMPSRPIIAPIDREQLERFRFFRRLGLFGIDPDDPECLEPMRAHVAKHFASAPAAVLWLTPQGRFVDVREPIRIRPGAAAIAAASEPVDALAIAIEFAFWQDQRPEVFLRARAVQCPGGSTGAWQRAFTAAMQENANELASLVRARDPSSFESVVGGDVARINPVYDLWLRATGRAGSIPGRRRAGETDQADSDSR